jgi:hypothetical protein
MPRQARGTRSSRSPASSFPDHRTEVALDSIPEWAERRFFCPNRQQSTVIASYPCWSQNAAIPHQARRDAGSRFFNSLLHTREVAGSKPAAPISMEPCYGAVSYISGPARWEPQEDPWKRLWKHAPVGRASTRRPLLPGGPALSGRDFKRRVAPPGRSRREMGKRGESSIIRRSTRGAA